MEEALGFRSENSISLAVPKILGFAILVFTALAFAIFGLNFLLFGIALLSFVLISLLPLPMAVPFYFFYLLFDGAIKILSNYHPLLHVAQDLLLIILFFRSSVDRNTIGFRKFSNTPFFPFILLFFLWILIQFVNPYGIGILPSIAGAKVYLTGIIFFVLCYHHIDQKSFDHVFLWLVFLGLFQSSLACIEYLFFQEWVYQLHPKYAQIAGLRFVGPFFRPFGTTYGPGAPSMWACLTLGPAFYLIMSGRRPLAISISILHLFVSCFALVFCQVRSAMLIAVLFFLAVLVCPHRGFAKRMSIAFVALVFLSPLIYLASQRIMGGILVSEQHGISETVQLELLQKRALSTFGSGEIGALRSNALESSVLLAKDAPFGIGLSRVGAAAVVWKDRIEQKEFFGLRWAFVDNMYRAIFTELGLFGLLSWILMVGAISFFCLAQSFRKASLFLWFCSFYVFILLFAGAGSEGILYNPTSSFFWMMLALGTKEATTNVKEV